MVPEPAVAPERAAAEFAPPFSRYVFAVGGIVFAVLMALSDRYGFQRDELYMVECGRHLQASYVDQPAGGQPAGALPRVLAAFQVAVRAAM